MSDSVANLTVKVDTKSVSAAVKALDALAVKAGVVYKQMERLGNGAAAMGKAQEAAEKKARQSESALAKMEKRLEDGAKKYEQITRLVNKHALSEGMRADTMNRVNRALEQYNRVASNVNATTIQIDRATRRYNQAIEQTKTGIDSVIKLENQRATEAKKNAAEAVRAAKEAMQGSRAVFRQAGGYQNLIDHLIGDTPQQRITRRDELAKLRSQIERTLTPATGTVLRQAGGYQNLIDHLIGDTPQQRNIRNAELAKLRSQIERSLTPATGMVLRQAGGYQDMINRLTSGGTGRQNDLAAFYADQEKKAVAQIERTARLLQSRLEQAQTAVFGLTTRAGRQLSPDVSAAITQRAETAQRRLSDILRVHGVNSLEAAKATGEFNRTLKGLSSDVARVGGLLPRLSDNARVISAAFGAANASVGGFSRVLFNTLPAVQALLGAFALREITQSIMEFERFTNTLKTVSGSTGEFNRNLGFLFAEANRIGFAVGEVGNSFARLSLAMKGTGFSADESKTAFSQLAEASRNFGLSSADTMGVIRALEQSMSKGKFMAEEVRLQLGDRLPIAMAALDRAVTKVDGKQADLNKRFEEGSLDVKRYGLEFIRQINAMSGGADTLSRTQNSIAAALGRLNNELVLVTTTFGEGGFTNAIIIATQNFIAFLQALREIGVISAAGAAMELLAKQTALLTTALAALAAALSVGILAKLARFAVGLSPIGRIIAGLAAAATAAVTFTASLNPTQRALNNLTAAGNDFNRAFDKAKGVSEEFRTAMTATNNATRTAVTETDEMIGVYRRLGYSEIEITRIVGEETLKRMVLQEKEMEHQIKIAQQAIGVRRNAILNQNADFAKITATYEADLAAIAARTEKINARGTSEATEIALKKEVDELKKAIAPYENLMKIRRDYVAGTIDEKTALERLRAERENHPELVDATRLAIEKNAKTLEVETKALKANLDRQKEIRREREAVAAIVARPEISQAIRREDETGGAMALRDTSGTKKMLDAFNEGLKQFQEKYGDNKFTSQMKDVEKVVVLAGQKLEYFGITARMTSSDILLALASNQAFAQSFPELAGEVRKFAAEIDKARNPLRAYTDAVNIEIAQNDKLIAASKQSVGAFREAEIAIRAEKEARALSEKTGVSYQSALEAIIPAVRRLAEQEKELADFRDRSTVSTERSTETLDKYLATLNAQIRDQDRIAAAYRTSTQAGEDAELQLKAETEAIRLGAKTEEQRIALKKQILPLLQKEAQGEKDVAAAKDLPRMRDEIALLEKERSLLGQSVSLREQELAAFRARQQLQGRDPAIIDEAERLARDTVKLRQENQQLENSYNELANIGVRAFEQVGDAITEAFAKGEIRALNFGNVIRGVMSSIVQSILRLGVVNPIINSIFSGTMLPTLGAGLSVLGGGGAAAAGAAAGGGPGIMQMLGLSSLIPKEGIFGSLGLTGPGGLLSTQIFAPYGAGAAIMEPSIATGAAGFMGPSGGLTLGSFLGAAGLGFGAGTFLNSMLGGNQMGGMAGSGLGSAAGALLAGAGLLGPLGPIAAALIGGLAGGGLGGLIGPKPSSKGFGYALRGQGGGLAMTDMFYNEQGRAQFEEASAKIPAINAYLKQRGLTVSGDRAVGGNRFGMGNLGYGEAASFNEALASMRFAAAANEELNKALSTRSFAGPEKLQEFVDGFIALQDTIKGLTEDPVPEFKKQMDALIDSFAQAAAKAREYGVNEEELLKARDKAIAKLEEQRNLSLRDMALGLEIRRLTAQGMEQEAERIQLSYNTQKEIEAFTSSLDALGITAEEKSKLLIALEETQAIEREKVIKESTKNIRDYLDSLRTSSELSGTTGMGRLTAAQDIFNRDLAAAQAGDKEAISRITQSADTLLNLARSIYGSTASFYDIRNQVVPGLEGLVNAPPTSGPQSLMNLADVPLVSEVLGARQNAALTESLGYSQRFDEKLAALLPIAEDIRDAVQQANQDLSTSLGSVGVGDYTGPDSSAGGGFGDLGGMDSGGGGGGMQAALGAVMKYGRVTAYAYGGIPDFVNSPTMAPMALFGEAGPEAIMPLRRGADGRLGVEVNSNGSQAVVAELRAVRNEIVNLRETVDENDRDQGAALVDVVSDLRIQIGELREELRTTRLRAQ